jgi:hypothetical protein
MEDNQILEQLKQHEENIRAEIRKSAKKLERNVLTFVILSAILLYFLLK